MANTASNLQEQDRIINAIENASDAELAALADIRNLLQKVNSGSDGLIINRPSRTLLSNRSPQRNSLGLKLVEKKQANNKEKNEPQNGIIRDSIEHKKEGGRKRDSKRTHKRTISDSNQNKTGYKTDKTNIDDNLIPNSVSFKSYLKNKKELNGDAKKKASIAAERILTEVKTQPARSLRDTRVERGERLRTASGRFASKDKNESIRTKKDGENERKANEKMQAGFLRRLGGVIGDSTKSIAESGDNSALDVAGSAGGSFWKAGKEVAGVISNTKDNVVSLHDWVQGKREAIKPAEKQAAIQPPSIRPLKFGGDKETTSAKEFSAQNQTQQTKAIQEQTKLNQVNDEKMIGLLEDIADKKGGSAGGGILDKIFGAMAIKSIGKKIGTKLGAAILAALGINKLKSLLSKNAGSVGDDLDIDTGRTSRKGKKGKKSKRGVKKAKKANVLKRLVKGKAAAKAVTATVAAGGAAYAGKKILENTGEQVGESTIKKGATKAAEKTVEKSTVKATEKTMEKGAAKVAGKGAEKVAEKGAVKAASKLATKTALKAVPLLGTAISAGMDAYDGYSDTDAQRETFGLKEGEEVSSRHKSEYALANVADMGGLVSGGAGLLADGANYLGMDSIAKKLTFDTADIAKSIDSKVSGVISLFSSDSKKTAEDADKGADERNKTLIDTVKKGASDTIEAINKLVSSGVSAIAGAVGIGDIKAPVPTAAGKMQLDTMAGKFASLEQQYGLPAGLLRGVATTESQGENGARSSAGAKGMFQFMPKTAAEYGLTGEDVYDPDKSAAAAAKKLSGLVKQYNGDVGLALSAYNWGEGNIQRKGMAEAPKETREYAPKVFAAMQAAGAAVPSTSIAYTKEQKVTESTLNTPKASTEVKPIPTPEATESAPKAIAPASKTPAVSTEVNPSSKPTEPASKAKFDESKSKPQQGKAKDSAGGTGFWAMLKKARDAADNKLAGYADNVQGVRSIRPDAGLTLPKGVNASDLPAGLQMAMLPANQIAQAAKAKRIENRAHTAVAQPDVYSGKSLPITAPVTHKAGGVVSASDLNRELPADYQAPQPAKQTGSFSQSLADIVLPSAADTFKNMTQGFTSGGIIDDVVGSMGLGNGQARALSPLTGFMTKKIDSGVSGMVDSVSSSIRQPASLTMPRTLPTVTDLAASGVKTPVTRDKSSNANDKAVLTELKKIATTMDKLLGIQKEENNKGKDPNTTSNSAQPAPRSDIPLGSTADALFQMLSDRN